jgi:hypothetical protein
MKQRKNITIRVNIRQPHYMATKGTSPLVSNVLGTPHPALSNKKHSLLFFTRNSTLTLKLSWEG